MAGESITRPSRLSRSLFRPGFDPSITGMLNMMPRQLHVMRRQPAQPAKKIKLSRQLSKLINYVQSVHFNGFETEGEHNAMHTWS